MHRQRGYNMQAGAKDSWLQDGISQKVCIRSVDFLPKMAELLFIIMYIISIRAFHNTIADFTIMPHEEYGKKTGTVFELNI